MAERAPNEPRTERKFVWVNRSILGIGLASLFSDVGHEMATAAMPVLLASFGASSALLGLIEGAADGLSSFAKLFSGLYSDRLRRRKPLAVAGYFVTATAMASFALATQWWHVLLARVGGWIGRGARSPVRNVLLTEATSPATYGRAFGLERAMDSAGAVIGPALSVALVSLVGLRPMFLITLIPGLLAAAAIMFLVREEVHEPAPEQTLWHGVRALPDEFRRYLIGVGIAGIGDFSKTLLILWATQAWTPRLGLARAATLAMTFYIGYNLVYTISCYVSGLLADRFPKRWVLAIGYSVAVIPATALLLPGDSLGKFAVIFAFAGLYMGVWETLENSTAATLLPVSVRGLGFGVLATVNGIGDFISSAAVGVLWVFSPFWAMLLVIVSSLGGAAIIASTRPTPNAGSA
ncbi:MAG: MFS transporter [Chthoniobacterales bacterium]|nr:MFS transporter [Chthoniobacterales bacterium]